MFSIDFAPVKAGELKMLQYAARFTRHDLRQATNEYLDVVLDIIGDASDAEMTFDPIDEKAHDPYAVKGEETIGWNLAHLVLHVTASLEEAGAWSSMLARGIPIGGRLRYEPPWRAYTTRSQVLQRIEECRRICLAYLDTWPDDPHLNVYRVMDEKYRERVGDMNAVATYLSGLRHLNNHLDQFRDVRQQARAGVRLN